VTIPVTTPAIPQSDRKTAHELTEQPPAYHVDSDVSLDSEDDSDNDHDLPPPYKV
jgi:hypothetical protein